LSVGRGDGATESLLEEPSVGVGGGTFKSLLEEPSVGVGGRTIEFLLEEPSVDLGGGTIESLLEELSVVLVEGTLELLLEEPSVGLGAGVEWLLEEPSVGLEGGWIEFLLEEPSVVLVEVAMELMLAGRSVMVPLPKVELVSSPLVVSPDVVEGFEDGELPVNFTGWVGVRLVFTKDRDPVLVSGRGMIVSELAEIFVAPAIEVRIRSVPITVEGKTLENTPVLVPGGTMLLLFADNGKGGELREGTSWLATNDPYVYKKAKIIARVTRSVLMIASSSVCKWRKTV
jgi:hypothetical protein